MDKNKKSTVNKPKPNPFPPTPPPTGKKGKQISFNESQK